MQDPIGQQIKLFGLLEEIDKEYSKIKSTDFFKDKKTTGEEAKVYQANVMKRMFDRKISAKRQIKKLESKLLSKYAQDHETKEYINLILENIKEKNPENILLFRHYPTHPHAQQYGYYYDECRYQSILNYCKLSNQIEKSNCLPEDNALKLTVLFDSPRKALDYITKNLKQGIHFEDSCAFTLPDVSACDFEQWRKFASIYMNDAGFKKILKNAVEVENEIKKNQPNHVNEKISVSKISDKKREIEFKNRVFKTLDRKAGNLTPIEECQREDLIDELFQLREELYHLSAGIKLKDADLLILKSYFEQNIKNNSAAYGYFLQNRLKPNDFINKFLELERRDDDRQIPNIRIDGGEVGCPGTYLRKLNVLDEMDAAMAACLGKLTNCCQSLSGEMGEPCVIHGLTNPYAGFYVACQGNVNYPRITDKVLGQCWVWRAKGNEISQNNEINPKNPMVIDSFEISDEVRYNLQLKRAVLRLLKKLTKELVLKGYTTKVACGTMSGIAGEIGLNIEENKKEEFIDDYNDHCDSRLEQYVLADINYLFYWYDVDEDFRNKTEEIIEQEIQKGKDIISSKFIGKMLNWAILSDRDHIVQRIKELTKHDVQIKEIIKYSKQYVQGDIYTNYDYFSKAIKNNQILLFIRDFEGNTPLITALKNNLIDCAIHMVDLNADLMAKDWYGNTPLHIACELGNLAVVNKMIAHGADINLLGKQGKTPLHIACEVGNLELAECLIENNANLNVNALSLACINEDLDIVDLLLRKGARVNVGGYSVKIPLHIACENGNIELVDKLIENGAEVDFKDSKGKTALHIVCEKGDEELVEILLAQKADINMRDRQGMTPLHIACLKGNYPLIKKLLDKGADKDILTFYNETPLHIACERGNLNVVKMFIESGANCNLKNDLGKTPLHCAIMRKHKKIAKELVKKGANLDIVDLRGKTPIEDAKMFLSSSFAKKLESLQEQEINRNTSSKKDISSKKNGLFLFLAHSQNKNEIKNEDKGLSIPKKKEKSDLNKNLRRP